MSIWAQIGDDRVTAVPPDGRTAIDLYAAFLFGNDSIPQGTQVTFLVGKGGIPDSAGSPADLAAAVSPIAGISLLNPIGIVQSLFVRDGSGNLSSQLVAKVTLLPIADVLKDNVTVIAYSTFDRSGLVARLAFSGMTLTVSSGEGVFSSSVEQYDSVGNAWTSKAPMPTGRSGLAAHTVGGKVYAIGGFNGNFTNANEQYDPIADSWATKAPMSIARGFGASAVVGTNIFVLGGYDFDPGRATAVCEKYDTVGDAWTTLSPMPYPVAFSTAQAVGTNIFVFYGGTKFDDHDVPSVFNGGTLKYDTVLDKWSMADAIYAGAPATTVSANVAVGAFSVPISASAGFPASGAATINRGGGTQETVFYTGFQNGSLLLSAPLQFAHLAGESVDDATSPRQLLAPNSYYDGTLVNIFNGFDGTGASATFETYNPISANDVLTGFTPNLPRFKAGLSKLGVLNYIVGGSTPAKSDYLGQMETLDSSHVFSGPAGFAKLLIFRTSFGLVTANNGVKDFLYAMGGQGSGHSPGWLQMNCKATPDSVKANGQQTASVTVSAIDASGDPPPDGLKLNVRGIVFISKSQTTTASTTTTTGTAVQSSTGSATTTQQERNPPPTISILPVLFSANQMVMTSGLASTILLPRSEDFIDEVQNLLNFVKGNEILPNQESLKSAAKTFDNQVMTVGDVRQLYKIAVDITVSDPFFFGQSDSEAAAAEVTQTGSVANSSFSFNPASATQGQSASVGYVSDIASVPDVEFVNSAPVDLPTLTTLIDEVKQEIPFGASPHYDALFAGASARIIPPPSLPLLPPANIMVSASDNENSGSASTAADVAEEVNLVSGPGKFPVFITTVVVTDPISLAARAARTDVADYELISSETGGSSFSLDTPAYVNFIIDRIKTSAPSSIGAGTIKVRHSISGAVTLLRFVVDNMVAGNSATLTATFSADGYNFEDLGVLLSAPVGFGPQTVSFALPVPIKAQFIEYLVTLTSSNFDSPILDSVSIQYVQPNVQYLFTYPQNVHGQISEIAAVTNERLPAGSKVEVGVCHGASLEFERDFESNAQPSVQQRGTIVAVNRAFGTIFEGIIFRDILQTDDGLIYVSKEGPWALDAITSIFVNQIEALPSDFIPVPEEGKIVFRKRLGLTDVVAMEVQNPSQFRVGLRIENPALQTGVLDSFAFMFGETAKANGLTPNKPPAALNLFISPTPVFAGGPLQANYKYVDPDGDSEDITKTQIVWFRNGSPVVALNNKRSVTNDDLIASRADASKDNQITARQEWFFTVRPSDGFQFGPLAISPPIRIANTAPFISAVSLTSSNVDPLTFSSQDTVTVNYKFTDLDDNPESGTLITFFVNGIQAKSGTDLFIDPTEEDSLGNKFLTAGNTVSATVTPSDTFNFGAPVNSNVVTIGSSPPSVTNVSVLPTQPASNSSLVLSYQFITLDKLPDQSTIAWFANDSRQTNFDNVKQIAAGNLKPGQSWYAIVTPNDGTSTGTPVKSNVVLVQS